MREQPAERAGNDSVRGLDPIARISLSEMSLWPSQYSVREDRQLDANYPMRWSCKSTVVLSRCTRSLCRRRGMVSMVNARLQSGTSRASTIGSRRYVRRRSPPRPPLIEGRVRWCGCCAGSTIAVGRVRGADAERRDVQQRCNHERSDDHAMFLESWRDTRDARGCHVYTRRCFTRMSTDTSTTLDARPSRIHASPDTDKYL